MLTFKALSPPLGSLDREPSHNLSRPLMQRCCLRVLALDNSRQSVGYSSRVANGSGSPDFKPLHINERSTTLQQLRQDVEALSNLRVARAQPVPKTFQRGLEKWLGFLEVPYIARRLGFGVRGVAYGSGPRNSKHSTPAISERSTLPRDRLSPDSPTIPPSC